MPTCNNPTKLSPESCIFRVLTVEVNEHEVKQVAVALRDIKRISLGKRAGLKAAFPRLSLNSVVEILGSFQNYLD